MKSDRALVAHLIRRAGFGATLASKRLIYLGTCLVICCMAFSTMSCGEDALSQSLREIVPEQIGIADDGLDVMYVATTSPIEDVDGDNVRIEIVDDIPIEDVVQWVVAIKWTYSEYCAICPGAFREGLQAAHESHCSHTDKLFDAVKGFDKRTSEMGDVLPQSGLIVSELWASSHDPDLAKKLRSGGVPFSLRYDGEQLRNALSDVNSERPWELMPESKRNAQHILTYYRDVVTGWKDDCDGPDFFDE